MFRFLNFARYSVTEFVERQLAPRISQIFAPLLVLMEAQDERRQVLELISDYTKELSLDRSIELDSLILEVVNELWNGQPLPLRTITKRLNEKHADDLQESVSGKRVGFVIRKVLGIKTRKRSGLFEILPTEQGRIETLSKRFGLKTEAA